MHDSILSVLSSRGLGGRWESPDHLEATSILGHIELDFTHALLPPSGIVEIQAQSIFGSIEILVPDGAEVEIDCWPFCGSIEHKMREGKGAGERIREVVTDEDPDLEREEEDEPPFFRITGSAIFGSVTVKSR